jgi:hypothetical protein
MILRQKAFQGLAQVTQAIAQGITQEPGQIQEQRFPVTGNHKEAGALPLGGLQGGDSLGFQLGITAGDDDAGTGIIM